MAICYVLVPAPPERGVLRSVHDGWWLPLLVAANAGFTLAMIVLGPMSAEAALTTAGKASALAVAATYLKPAVLHVGTLLRLRGPARPAPPCSLLPQLTLLLVLELGVVAAGVLWARLDTAGALQLAILITVLCTAVCYGEPALRAFGRRMFPPDHLDR